MQSKAPANLAELKARLITITNQKIIDIAKTLNLPLPNDLSKAKGWIGQLLEYALGATAGNQAMHDFPELNIEMKTIPVNHFYQPIESTYICTANLSDHVINWEDSWVCRKLQHVLWVPIDAVTVANFKERRVHTPFFWQPSLNQQTILKQDWEELTELLELGNAATISAKYGTYLQIRPKAANSKVLIDNIDYYGNYTKTVPKGFYLRSSFTKTILKPY